MTTLTVRNLSVSFPATGQTRLAALQDVSFTIAAGEMVAILGPSGCGKTTLLNVLAGFLRPTSGEALLNGHPISGPGAERGVVFQQGALFEWMSVKANVTFGPRMKGMPRAERDALARRLLGLVGLSDVSDRAVHSLSGGMQQRVALARCLANDPALILMDEPLGALDALTREKMQELVLKLWHEAARTVVLITHSVEEAMLLGERLFIMAPRPGRILQDYRLPFARAAQTEGIRAVKQTQAFQRQRDEILSLIWDMEEAIMGSDTEAEPQGDGTRAGKSGTGKAA
ncbi:ABC transporter ATP-binding protein [Cereibacter azotoformans]|uniref:Taurine transport system ATP-binding protein n=1 Tax=Cereibacter azotoformans TaxID=43057 RepID=A0A2T5JT81_9RHOB|nr:ABC transporter ATP-binding protein [Cereibacter azotoformans]AXQ95721.1 ABC transporter ATP-binding protein [Cereibacter sphaeroides]PTR12983.1 taurine transport system ATP-binding protein [Cereibacter azotoformans]UIJ32779.1 ABC transporter ATP-binding protein [Cereibacter azotoformans]